ncbi:MAG: glycosyltransferase family 39 protein, partial [Muribaculaceae bacterium]|nr:glycosyltransferase family 39 protein [Muribaculaceae bacterium]
MADKTAIIHNYRHRYTLPLLMAGLVIAMLPMMLFREFTPANELRYLSIADEAIRNGQWWAFTNHGIPYADKPPLYIWCVILGKLLLGKHLMWFLSLFSIIPACVTALIMDRWTRKELAPNFQTAGTLMLFSCGLFAGMIFTLRMDMMMTMFIVLALYQFRRLETAESKPTLSKRL